jgi:cytoskeletal protein RodZ
MSDFGTRLREARERRGIPLRQIADRTKISMAALEALERSDASKLPSGIFGRSFVRSYALEVGLDPDATLGEFLDRFSDARFAMMPATPAEPVVTPAPRLAGIALKLLLAVLVAMGIILYFTLFKGDPSPDPRPDSARRASRRVAMAPVPRLSRLP